MQLFLRAISGILRGFQGFLSKTGQFEVKRGRSQPVENTTAKRLRTHPHRWSKTDRRSSPHNSRSQRDYGDRDGDRQEWTKELRMLNGEWRKGRSQVYRKTAKIK